MITREEFPYLQELLINDAYAVKDRRVTVFEPGQEFKHLVLTGRNGSGKTTVLRGLAAIIENDLSQDETASDLVLRLGMQINQGDNSIFLTDTWQKVIDKLHRVTAHFESRFFKPRSGTSKLLGIGPEIITTVFSAARAIQLQDVSSVTREDKIAEQLNKKNDKSAADLFKQYLVNKKIFQVFDTLDGKDIEAKNQESFFISFELTLSKIFEDPDAKLEFVRDNFEFYINLSDGRRFTFNQLSAGYSAFLSILTELLMRTDLLRKQANDYTYDPCGFVLIDEPETHLHLEMQYQILPLLTSLFPNLQFIVATHSPAVASSIKNATVYDLSTGETLGDSAAGSSFSELMQTHFGLENEYSNVADAILDEVAAITALPDRVAARARLQRLLDEQGRYMSPVLRLDVQAQLLTMQNDQAA